MKCNKCKKGIKNNTEIIIVMRGKAEFCDNGALDCIDRTKPHKYFHTKCYSK